MAIIDAAAIDIDLLSPFIIEYILYSKSGNLFPSTNIVCGWIFKFKTALFIASKLACKIFILSISSTEAIPIANLCWEINSSLITSLFFFDSFFESLIPSGIFSLFKIIAADITGPARGPLPTSSTPIIGVS